MMLNVIVQSKESWNFVWENLERSKVVAFDTETDGLHSTRKAIGASLAWESPKGEVYGAYFPLRHLTPQLRERVTKKTGPQAPPSDLPVVRIDDVSSATGPSKVVNVDSSAFWERLARLLADDSRVLVMHNAKFDLHVLRNEGIHPDSVKAELNDTMLMAWLLCSRVGHGLKALAKSYLGSEMVQFEAFATYSANARAPIEEMGPYAIDDAVQTLRLFRKFSHDLDGMGAGLRKVYGQLEMPVVRVIEAMESEGFKLDATFLREIHVKMEAEQRLIESGICTDLNLPEVKLSSTRWLSDTLIDQRSLWGLPGPRGKSGGFSTAEAVLDRIAKGKVEGTTELGRKLAEKIVRHRHLAKLCSTYTTALLDRCSPDMRIHASFNQMGTVTGRFSSSDPNLQNIPRPSEDLPPIRKAFIARDGFKIIDVDYSQIELRLLAHFSEDPRMCKVYAEGGDIHSETAATVGCTRQQAKSVNFGTVYGLGPGGLADQLGVSMQEAKKFLDRFFANYAGVRVFKERTVAFVQKNGFTTTLLGRRRLLEDIWDKDYSVASAAQRRSVNTKIQGSAADLIKVGMRNIDRAFRKRGWLDRAFLLSQVHDELLLEADADLAEEVAMVVKYELENAVKLKVPLIAEPHIGLNWLEAKA